MTGTRKRLNRAEKARAMKEGFCYVCDGLGLDHKGFDGYEPQYAHLDHYAIPFSSIGGSSGGTALIHAHPDGKTPDDEGFEKATTRNCHGIKSNKHNSMSGYINYVKARMGAREVEFIEDIPDLKGRDPSSCIMTWRWNFSGAPSASLRHKEYPIVEEKRGGVSWSRFLCGAEARVLFTDRESQVRPAEKKSLIKIIDTFLIDDFPVFNPINVRIDKCGHLVIFDGNHRATAAALSFGVNITLPIMVWNIEADQDTCAIINT
ncbi:MAG: hypothetical protein VKP57_08025 [Candidatus Sericytochromatia bacterium]|nr:hypothetical protein [Candidatus Sericytochromatia bacterium]